MLSRHSLFSVDRSETWGLQKGFSCAVCAFGVRFPLRKLNSRWGKGEGFLGPRRRARKLEVGIVADTSVTEEGFGETKARNEVSLQPEFG